MSEKLRWEIVPQAPAPAQATEEVIVDIIDHARGVCISLPYSFLCEALGVPKHEQISCDTCVYVSSSLSHYPCSVCFKKGHWTSRGVQVFEKED